MPTTRRIDIYAKWLFAYISSLHCRYYISACGAIRNTYTQTYDDGMEIYAHINHKQHTTTHYFDFYIWTITISTNILTRIVRDHRVYFFYIYAEGAKGIMLHCAGCRRLVVSAVYIAQS